MSWQPPPQYPPPPHHPPGQPWPGGYGYAPPPGNGQAVAALILGIAGLFFLLTGMGMLFFINLPCSVLAWVFGVKGRNRVDRGETPQHRSLAQAGFVMGIVGVILGAIAVLFWLLIIVVAISVDEADAIVGRLP